MRKPKRLFCGRKFSGPIVDTSMDGKPKRKAGVSFSVTVSPDRDAFPDEALRLVRCASKCAAVKGRPVAYRVVIASATSEEPEVRNITSVMCDSAAAYDYLFKFGRAKLRLIMRREHYEKPLALIAWFAADLRESAWREFRAKNCGYGKERAERASRLKLAREAARALVREARRSVSRETLDAAREAARAARAERVKRARALTPGRRKREVALARAAEKKARKKALDVYRRSVKRAVDKARKEGARLIEKAKRENKKGSSK